MKKVVCFILSLSLGIAFWCMSVQTSIHADVAEIVSGGGDEKKVYSNATIEDDFTDCEVLVKLTHEASMKFKTYDINDFPEIDCIKVETINDFTKNRCDNLLKKAQVAFVSTKEADFAKEYNELLCIELKDKSKENVLNAMELLQKRDDVVCAEPNEIVSICSTTPNDTLFSKQWAAPIIKLPNAWDVTKGLSTVTVAVVDSGIDGNHPDLKNRIDKSLCRDFTSGSMVSVNNPTDPHGHGTHVAGIIGAEGNNNLGVAGVCWNVKLVSLRVFVPSSSGSAVGETKNIAKAFYYAGELSIPITNYSGNTGNSESVRDAIEMYRGLFVCSAGNNENNNDSVMHYPSNYYITNMIVVGASNRSDGKASFSNYGKLSVDIFAPGEGIESTLPDGKYGEKNGTSMATPYVTGVAALIYSVHPNASPEFVKSTILFHADKIAGLSEYCVTGGRLNAYKAVAHAYSIKSIDENSHELYCRDCGTTVTEYHEFDDYVDYGDSMYHKGTCYACGLVRNNLPHNWSKMTGSPELSSSIDTINIMTTDDSIDANVWYKCNYCGAISFTPPPQSVLINELHESCELKYVQTGGDLYEIYP